MGYLQTAVRQSAVSLECCACRLRPSVHVGRSNWVLLRLAESGDVRALQVDVGVSGRMCLLVVYNFCDDCRLAYRARSESRKVEFCTWDGSMAAECDIRPCLGLKTSSRSATTTSHLITLITSNIELLSTTPKYGFVFLKDDVPNQHSNAGTTRRGAAADAPALSEILQVRNVLGQRTVRVRGT